MTNYKTMNGYNDDEVVSALQKDIRRGNELLAFHWAMELYSYTNQGFSRLINRLKVILYEDIGLGNPNLIPNISIAINDLKEMADKDKSEWKLMLSYIILMMCRSKKSRITDDFIIYYNNIQKKIGIKNGIKIEIPDYALDIHTTRGRELGRDKKHFKEIGSKLKNENKNIKNIYK